MYVLSFSIYAECVICLAIFCWGIKLTLFQSNSNYYCTETYGVYNEDLKYCNNDILCRINNDECLCVLGISIKILWWIVFALLSLNEIKNIWLYLEDNWGGHMKSEHENGFYVL